MVVVAMVGAVEFVWPIVWVCWVFVASCVGGFMGGFCGRKEVRKKLINK